MTIKNPMELLDKQTEQLMNDLRALAHDDAVPLDHDMQNRVRRTILLRFGIVYWSGHAEGVAMIPNGRRPEEPSIN